MAALTAQTRYAEMLKHFISPTLREWGWTGSAGKYQRTDDGVMTRAWFQKSQSSGRLTVSFRVNISRQVVGTGEILPPVDDADRWWLMSTQPEFDPEAEVDAVLEYIKFASASAPPTPA